MLGISSFYAGYTKKFFNEDLYIYQSMGVNLPGEPDNVFKYWRHITRPEERENKSIEMNTIYDPKGVETINFKGESFLKAEKNGNRYFWLDGRR
ncbi:hypothetical protein JQC92_00005 [Shewanella sp. 202IG2-18]|uniref:hypothetical protein n=1 Tax=Parashewanella hymeniacidonis TaxID=2807618 RepID=UPI00196198AB|nr:hypothetical protein [Parashewanella hymeniacidonis]MBM7070436.1 hypothetical protein [Parashewanella hymeniacidonis]